MFSYAKDVAYVYQVTVIPCFSASSGFSRNLLVKALKMAAKPDDRIASTNNTSKKRCLRINAADPSTLHQTQHDTTGSQVLGEAEELEEDECTGQLECAPKDFSKADAKMRTATTKGTFQIISPCGAKIAISEMVTTESLTSLFTLLSDVMPLIVQDMTAARQQRLQKTNMIYTNAKTGEVGDDFLL
jgi:hypothetical protein